MTGEITINLNFNEAAEFVVELSQTAAEYLKAEDFDPLWTPQQTNDFVTDSLSGQVSNAEDATTAHINHPDGYTTQLDIPGRHLKAA